MKISILISSFNRLNLFCRTLFSIAHNRPKQDFEVVIADEGSTDDIVTELKNFNAAFKWKFINVDIKEFEEKTGIKKYHNNPSLTNNIAFKNCSGDLIFLMGNECIAWKDCFNQMIEQAELILQETENFIIFSTTFDVPQLILDNIDIYGNNLTQNMVNYCSQWPLQSEFYHSDVTNYLSLSTRNVWENIEGYDERYLGGVACEDSCFVKRAKLLPSFKIIRSQALSLHQSHMGKTIYYEPTERNMTKEKWDEGVRINREIYYNWDEKTIKNQQGWPIGVYGIKEIITNYKE